MKLPKFIKSTQQSAKKQKIIGGDQLLLTESTYSVMSNNKFFTPQKRVAFVINDYKYINDKTYGLVTPQQTLSNTSFKTSPSITNLFQLKTPINKTNFLDSVIPSCSSPRYIKSSASTKRLQRNRMQHVRSKPSNYMLRSTTIKLDSCDSVFVTPIRPQQQINNDDDQELLLNNSNSNKTTVTNNQPKSVERKQSLTKLIVSSSKKTDLTDSSQQQQQQRRRSSRNSYGSNCSSLSSLTFSDDSIEQEEEEEVIESTKRPLKRKVPYMGITSFMLKNKRVPHKVDEPIRFKSSDLAKSPTKKQQAFTSNNYDKLDRAAIINVTPKKVTTPTYLRHQTTCRISIYNGANVKIAQKNRKHYSSSQLNESQTYDSIIF